MDSRPPSPSQASPLTARPPAQALATYRPDRARAPGAHQPGNAPSAHGRTGSALLAGALAVLAMVALGLIQLGAATAAPAPPPSAPTARFAWPLAPPHPVLRQFEAPATPYGPGHRGVDLGGTPGEPVFAAADGVVVFAGLLAGRGVVSVDHEGGLRTTYEPLTPAVSAGEQVAASAIIGHLLPGHPECTGATACLHWGVRRGAAYLDPLGLVSSGRVRLLPWEP